MFRGIAFIFGCAALSSAAFGQPPAVKDKIVATDHQTVKATITYEIKTTNSAVNRWLVYLSEPPELASQTKVKVTTQPVSKVVSEKSPLARKVRYFDITVPKPAPGAKLVLRQDIQATLRARTLVPLDEGEKPPQVAALTTTEQKYYVSRSSVINFDAKPFRDWLGKKDLLLKKSEAPLAFAARVMEVIRADYQYKTDVKQDQNAAAVCERTTGDCASMTALFVGALRANKIPARALVGRLAKPRAPGTPEGESDQSHVRAEVYVAGIGWVPVDPAFANSDKNQPVEAFIGHDTGDMLVLHVDVDLRLQYLDQETTTGFLQGSPNYKVFGKGAFDGTLGPTGWELKATLIEK